VRCTLDEVASLSETYNLCVTGDAIMHLTDVVARGDFSRIVNSPEGKSFTARQRESDVLRKVFPFVTIYSRVTPGQKEVIISTLNECGHYTMMCGGDIRPANV
jgi:magnesium-transporting ATPase (P-type)